MVYSLEDSQTSKEKDNTGHLIIINAMLSTERFSLI